MSDSIVTAGIVFLLLIIWRVWGWLSKRPRRQQRHYDADWDGTHATCFCGYNSVWDWNLERHFKEMERAGL